jgi:hypothetical protein
MMVGYPPGGPTDTLARILGDAMGHSLGQTIVIETVTGASGTNRPCIFARWAAPEQPRELKPMPASNEETCRR